MPNKPSKIFHPCNMTQIIASSWLLLFPMLRESRQCRSEIRLHILCSQILIYTGRKDNWSSERHLNGEQLHWFCGSIIEPTVWYGIMILSWYILVAECIACICWYVILVYRCVSYLKGVSFFGTNRFLIPFCFMAQCVCSFVSFLMFFFVVHFCTSLWLMSP